MTNTAVQRQRISISGIVQGVGFRPFVYRLATEHALAGFVGNDSTGVTIEVEGPNDALERFRHDLFATPPPLARIDAHATSEVDTVGRAGFSISPSRLGTTAAALIPPDIAVCDDCLRELFDPNDRRYRYPFINCTNCGPRYTIVEGIPYDRAQTSMKTFPMCLDCAREYHDPNDRRFHAQPVACPVCGPRVSLHDGNRNLPCDDPIAAAIGYLKQGRILAIRGLGGFHLAVDATNDDAVRELRRRKHREEKPLALMAADLATIKRYCDVNVQEESLLTDPSCPIVLLNRRSADDDIAPSVVFDNRHYGFMLPYTPLHHLIIRGNFTALVMTSGNLAEEPIAIGNDEALVRLADIADCFLLHDREILQRCDDSIVRVSDGQPRLIRRSRGYVPKAIYLPSRLNHKVLAVGGELKNTVALGQEDRVLLSQHIGDLDNPAALDFFEQTIDHLGSVFDIEPDLIACDVHPDYLSTKWARVRAHVPVLAVQHHHAHLVAVMADSGVVEPTIGIILDGTGYGPDGTIWGGEVLIGDARRFERFAHLQPVPLPGGTAAVEQPWRVALSYLHAVYGKRYAKLNLPLIEGLSTERRETIIRMIERGINSPMTSSCGRLFDGVAALLGLGEINQYEAQAAIALENSAAAWSPSLAYHRSLVAGSGGRGALSVEPLIRAVVNGLTEEQPVASIAAEFHVRLAELLVRAALAARDVSGIRQVGLSGGVFQNVLLFEYLAERLRQERFTVLTHHNVPTNDGGLALGQVVIADARVRVTP